MLQLALKNLWRRPLRTGLTLLGLAVSVALMTCLLSFGQGYQSGLHNELDRMGMQLMLVPLGCPYDAAAKALKGKSLDASLPASALDIARKDPGVAVAAPMYTAAVPRPTEGRTDLWVGIDEATRTLKPWWKLTEGSTWFKGPDSVILGAEAASTEVRKPGDRFYSPETGKEFTVCGVLERSGTSDDSLFFVPLATAQQMFKEPNRLTAVAIRLKDPSPPSVEAVSVRLQKVPGAQVATLSEMMGTFLNLIGAARTLILAIAIVAIAISGLSIFNTMMAAVLERTRELGVLRAVGMSRVGAFALMTTEAVVLSLTGAFLGFVLALLCGGALEHFIRPFIPLAPEGGLPSLTAMAVGQGLVLLLIVGFVAGLYPAWQACRLRPAEALRLD
jgi:putative ABC transport system permease protein